MTAGVWLAYVRRDRAVPLGELGRRMAEDPDVTEAVTEADVLRIEVHDPLTANDAAVHVLLDTGDHVALEAYELATFAPPPDPGVPPPDLEALAAADARYEVSFDPAAGDEVSNVLLVLVDVLRGGADAVVYDTGAGRFV